MSDAKRKLSDCIRPTVEAAPWVIEAVLELENKLAAAQEELNAERNRRFEGNRISSQEYNDCQKQLSAALDDLEVAKNVANGNVEAKFDAWKQLDAMEHELDAALEACKAKDDIILEVLECKSTTRPPIRLREALAIQPDDSALKDKAMTTYEQPKDWIERHLVEDPGGLLACEPSRLDTLNEELRLARQANEAQHQQLAAAETRLEEKTAECLSFYNEAETVIKQRDEARQRLAGANARIELMGETALNQQKREVMLRDALEYHQAQTRPIQRTEEALAATEPKEEGK